MSDDNLKNKLIAAYDKLMEELHALAEQAEHKGQELSSLLGKARDKLIETDELSRQEVEEVSDYLKRDLHNASEYLEDSARDMADWLHMDIELIEWNLMDLFLQTADKTKLDLLLLEENAKHVNEYHSGEITGPGILVCDDCGEELHFHNTGHIPPCPQCHSSHFTRKSR